MKGIGVMTFKTFNEIRKTIKPQRCKEIRKDVKKVYEETKPFHSYQSKEQQIKRMRKISLFE